jgi:hypothetical protein
LNEHDHIRDHASAHASDRDYGSVVGGQMLS